MDSLSNELSTFQIQNIFKEQPVICGNILVGSNFRSSDTSTRPEMLTGHNLRAGLASLIPKKQEPATMYRWSAGLASLLFWRSLASLLFKKVN